MRPARFERTASSAARGRLSPSEPARCCSKFLRHLIFNHSRTVSSRCTIRSLQYRDSDAAQPLLRPAARHPGHGGQPREARRQSVQRQGRREHQARREDPSGQPARAGEDTAEMPAQYAAMILLAAWCAMRFGELTELGAGVTSSSTRTRARVLSASSVRWCAPTAAPGHDAQERRRDS